MRPTLFSCTFLFIGKGGEEQAFRVHQNTRSSGQGELQGHERKEFRGLTRVLFDNPHLGVPQYDMDVAGFAHGYQERQQKGYFVAGKRFTVSQFLLILSNF